MRYQLTGKSDVAKAPLGHFGPSKFNAADGEPTAVKSAADIANASPAQDMFGNDQSFSLKATVKKMMPQFAQQVAPGHFVVQRTMQAAQQIVDQ